MIDPQLLSYASVRQIEYLEALEKYKSNTKAAEALGVNRRGFDQSLNRLKALAASKGLVPKHGLNIPIPDGYKMGGASVYREKTEDAPAHWLKIKEDSNRQLELLKEFALDLAEGVKGLAPVTPKPEHVHEDLMSVIPIGDPHFGLKVWAQEGGGNFDLDIAEKLTCSAIDRLLASAPPAHTAALLNLGDMFHADSQSNTTTAGTTVDVDGRWAKIQQIGLRAMIYCINRLLERHQRVIVRINRGNHDKHAAYALSLMLSCYFHDEPRVEVDLSPAAAWYMQFGSVLLASTHGDTIKGQQLMGVMAADRPEMWGATKHRYWFVGHIHHKDRKEYPGGIVEYVRTLAPGDAWHHGQGYRSGRDMELVVMHREHGEIERHRCDVGMLT